jgi:hypothetical protein
MTFGCSPWHSVLAWVTIGDFHHIMRIMIAVPQQLRLTLQLSSWHALQLSWERCQSGPVL